MIAAITSDFMAKMKEGKRKECISPKHKKNEGKESVALSQAEKPVAILYHHELWRAAVGH
jgi:hypothetical protein